MTFSQKQCVNFLKIGGVFILLSLIYIGLFHHGHTNFSLSSKQVVPELGKDYVLVDNTDIIPARLSKDSVSVIEFFSYECSICHEIEPALQMWQRLQGNAIKLERIPMGDNRSQSDDILRAHYVAHRLKENMTPKIFEWLSNNIKIENSAVLKKELMRLGISLSECEQTIAAEAGLDLQLLRGKNLEKLYSIEEIPTFIIAGRYKTNLHMTNYNLFYFFEIINALVAKVQAEDN